MKSGRERAGRLAADLARADPAAADPAAADPAVREPAVRKPTAPRPAAPRGEGFPRSARLRQKGEFQRVFAAGARVSSGCFRAVVLRNDLGHPRLGLAVSRRVGGAVQRNQVKRRLRELFRRNRGMLGGAVDLVVIPQPGADRLDFAAFQAQVLELLRRSGARA